MGRNIWDRAECSKIRNGAFKGSGPISSKKSVASHPSLRPCQGRARCSCRSSRRLREEGVPVSLREFLSFLEAMAAGLVIYDPEGFYHLARHDAWSRTNATSTAFDRAFRAGVFGGLEAVTADQVLEALDLPA